MRVSVYQDDPGYYPPEAPRLQVFLNGELMTCVATADEELGMIVQFKQDAAGLLALTADGTDIAKETLYGVVKILPYEEQQL